MMNDYNLEDESQMSDNKDDVSSNDKQPTTTCQTIIQYDQQRKCKFDLNACPNQNTIKLQLEMIFIENVRHSRWIQFLNSFLHQNQVISTKIAFNSALNASIVLQTIDDLFQKFILEILTVNGQTKIKKMPKRKINSIKKQKNNQVKKEILTKKITSNV